MKLATVVVLLCVLFLGANARALDAEARTISGRMSTSSRTGVFSIPARKPGFFFTFVRRTPMPTPPMEVSADPEPEELPVTPIPMIPMPSPFVVMLPPVETPTATVTPPTVTEEPSFSLEPSSPPMFGF
eukprot:TRINITY_DN5808_c0_g1_i1.p2 TRINITY_DN5808_c0_g1~~TRINITY_DN5808_c0_g1_i1.p2  ORF type:complete len:129 (+),score=21.30 TRINITY_DN5808_c0_g1_i1:133-519(+)